MNIYETEHFNVAYQQAPELTIRDNVHVGVEVLYYPGIRGRHIFRLYHRLVMAPWETALVLISMRSRCCRCIPNVHSRVRMYLERLIQILKAPTQDYYLLVRNCWAVPNFESSSKLQLITEGCMDDDLRRQGLDFEVTDNGHSHKVTFTIPVIKFVE